VLQNTATFVKTCLRATAIVEAFRVPACWCCHLGD